MDNLKIDSLAQAFLVLNAYTTFVIGRIGVMKLNECLSMIMMLLITNSYPENPSRTNVTELDERSSL